jgi:hypothetical protein
MLATRLQPSVYGGSLTVAQPRPLPQSDAPAPRPRERLFRFPRQGWRLRAPGRRGRIILGVIGVLLALIVIGSFFVDEPMRRLIERQMNDRMDGYTVRIERLSFHPIGLSLTLFGLTFSQNQFPDPPVLDIARLDASVEWKALMRGKLVANFALDEPKLYVHLEQLRAEAEDPKPVTDKGWQDAFQAIYPLKINEVKITDGQAVYVDPGPFEPLRLTGIQARVTNIRNIHSQARDYPSGIEAQATVFERGTLTIDGSADFLAEPHLGIKANIALREIPLDYFKPVTNRYNLSVSGGVLTAEGTIEYAPTVRIVHLRNAEVSGVKIDYIHTPAKEGAPKQAARKATQATKETADRPDLLVKAERVRVTRSEVGIINRQADPDYRLFFTDVSLAVDNVSNQRAEGVGEVRLSGLFMGSGRTNAIMSYRPTPKGPDFDLTVKLENTDMKTMNNLLRSYGKFDVVEGKFSLYSEMRGRGGEVTGYVKPLFKDIKAYDPSQDRDKGFVRRLYERIVSAASKLLENPPRDEVATKVDVKGRIDNPNTSTIQAIANLLRNAFIKAILPGLEREARSTR